MFNSSSRGVIYCYKCNKAIDSNETYHLNVLSKERSCTDCLALCLSEHRRSWEPITPAVHSFWQSRFPFTQPPAPPSAYSPRQANSLLPQSSKPTSRPSTNEYRGFDCFNCYECGRHVPFDEPMYRCIDSRHQLCTECVAKHPQESFVFLEKLA